MAGKGLQFIPHRIPKTWDPKWFETFIRDVLAKADIRNAAGDGVEISGQSDNTATLTVSQDIQDLLQQTYVLAAPSGFLQFERTLAGETGVVDIVDGGANSTITVKLALNGVPLSKLELLTAPGLLGNKFLTDSQPGLITPANAGQAITFNGTTLDWTDTPTWAGTHRWGDGFCVIFGDDDDLLVTHDGTDAHWSNVTGDSLFESTGDFSFSSATYTITTTGTEFHIDADGAWNIDGDPGTAGQVITSAGAGSPVVWADQTGGGGNVTPDTHPPAPDAMDDEFEGTTLDAKWAWRNQGGATITFTQGSAVIAAPNSASIQQRIIEQAVPAGAWRVRCKVAAWIAASNFTRAGLAVIRSASSKMLAVDTAYSTGFKHEANSWNVAGSYIGGITSGGTGSIGFLGDAYAPTYLEIEYDGSSVYTFRASRSGFEGTFFVIGTEAQATNLGGAADKVGIYVNVEGSAGDSRGAFDWFRRMA